MYSRECNSSKSTKKDSSPPTSNLLDRTFTVQSKSAQNSSQLEETVDLYEQYERQKHLEHNLSNIPVNAPGTPPPEPLKQPSPFLQAKFTIRQSENNYYQKIGQNTFFHPSEKGNGIVQPDISSQPTLNLQASFLSFALKMGAKRASLGMLKNFIKTQIRNKIKKIALKKFARQFAKEADDLIGILEDPWWVTAIGFIPIAGDAFDLARVPMQIRKAFKKADALEAKVKRILRIQGKKAGDLIPATLKGSDSYTSELAEQTYGKIVEMAASGNSKASKMKKLIEQTHRLMEKL